MFFIDDSQQLYQLIQDLKDKSYDIIERQNLSEIGELQLSLRNLKY